MASLKKKRTTLIDLKQQVQELQSKLDFQEDIYDELFEKYEELAKKAENASNPQKTTD